MTFSFTKNYIERTWNSDASKRTVLYYSFLLSQQASVEHVKRARKGSSRRKVGSTVNSVSEFERRLRDMTSIEKGDFESIIQEFVYFGVYTSADNLTLTPEANDVLKVVFQNTFGSDDPVPFNGLEIFDAGTDQRFSSWVEGGASLLIEIFGSIPGFRHRVLDVGRKRGQLLTIQTDITRPFLIMYFINTPRMKQMSEIEPLRASAQEILYQRMRDLGTSGVEVNMNSLKAITIVAAPTYSSSTAHEALGSEIPTRLTGPINLGALQHYFMNVHNCCREEQYYAFLDYLDPISGGIRGGIFFSNWLIEYLDATLEECYRLNECQDD